MPAASGYCKDPDNHSIEVLSVMNGAPNNNLGVLPYSQSSAQNGA